MRSVGEEQIEHMHEHLRMATCPTEICHRRLIFFSCAKSVRCRVCASHHASDRLHAIAPISVEVALKWLHGRAAEVEKMGEMGDCRLRIVYRLIDGVGSYHHLMTLSAFFGQYGVNESGKVVKLSEMGRSEPINVVTLSDYAFGISKEHLDVYGYGEDLVAAAVLSDAIRAVNKANAIRAADVKALVPLTILEKDWLYNAMSAVSRACVGQSVFTDRLTDALSLHVSKYGYRYKRIANYNDAQWSELMYRSPSSEDARPCHIISTIDLAVLANVMHRSILLLDIDQQPKVKVFVPFLRKPEQCVSRRGFPRSPIVVAWGDKSRTFKVPMVAMAMMYGIQEVRFPRAWFKSVWGFPKMADVDALLSKYLAFDSRGMCVVAHGVYFKPAYLREYVAAFDEFNMTMDGVHGTVLADYWRDVKLEVTTEKPSAEVIAAADQLWRCVNCGRLKILGGNARISCSICHKRGHRKQRIDGTIEFHDGDHTMTPAPQSWCFTKRKHFYGREYDNPARKIRLRFNLFGVHHKKTILWFSNESDGARNSSAYEVAAEFIKEIAGQSLDYDTTTELTEQVEADILQKVLDESEWDHRLKHLKECLVITTYEELFDDWRSRNSAVTSGSELLSSEVIEIIETAKALYDDFRRIHVERLELSGIYPSDDVRRAMWETDENMNGIEDDIFQNLGNTMADYDDEGRWRILSAEESLFSEGGLFHTYAKRRFRGEKHFKLPLFGNRNFAFSDEEKAISLCVEGAGHFLVQADVEKTAAPLVKPGIKKCESVE